MLSKLVVLFAVLVLATAKPSVTHGDVAVAPAVAVPSAVSYQTRKDIISTPVVETYAAAPVLAGVASAPVAPVLSYSAPAVPITAPAIIKNVQYAEKDVITGYSSQVLKPNLGVLATQLEAVSKTAAVTPARTVATYTPTITKIEPEISVKKVSIDIPVETPVVSEVEVPTTVVQAAPVVAAYSTPSLIKSIVSAPAAVAYAAPATLAYSAPSVAYSAPLVTSYSAPLVTSYSAPAVVKTGYVAAAPALSYSAPAVVKTSYAAPAIAYSAPGLAVPQGISTTEVRTNGLYAEARVGGW